MNKLKIIVLLTYINQTVKVSYMLFPYIEIWMRDGLPNTNGINSKKQSVSRSDERDRNLTISIEQKVYFLWRMMM